MPKFFVESNQIKDKIIHITGDDVNHIANVLRLQLNEEIDVGNKNTGVTYRTNIMEISRDKIKCQILNELDQIVESNVEVTIFQGLPKADKMEYIIQKSTEIGAKTIVPVKMRRCIAKIEEKEKGKKISRWQKIAEVAAKQSGRDIIPEIQNVMDLKSVKEIITKFDLVLVAYENEKNNTLKAILTKLHRERENRELNDYSVQEKLKIGVIIGPEGGLEKEEVEELKESGAEVITLGNRILRTETASTVILSNIVYEFD